MEQTSKQKLVNEHLEGFKSQQYKSSWDTPERSEEVATDSANITIERMGSFAEWISGTGWMKMAGKSVWINAKDLSVGELTTLQLSIKFLDETSKN